MEHTTQDIKHIKKQKKTGGVFAHTCTCKAFNEDAVACSDHFWVVVDGATGLENPDQMHTGSDAAWFSHHLVGNLTNLLKTQPDLDLTAALEQAIEPLRVVFPNSSPLSTPSAAIAMMAKRKDGSYDYLVLADCVLLAKTANGIQEVQDLVIGKLDNMALEKMIQLASIHHTNLQEQKSAIKDLLKANRAFKNRADGYGAADLDEDSAWKPLALTGHFQPGEIQSFALMSDGMYQYLENHDIRREDFYRLIEIDPEALLSTLVQELDADSACRTWPRLSIRDDISLVYVDLEGRRQV